MEIYSSINLILWDVITVSIISRPFWDVLFEAAVPNDVGMLEQLSVQLLKLAHKDFFWRCQFQMR